MESPCKPTPKGYPQQRHNSNLGVEEVRCRGRRVPKAIRFLRFFVVFSGFSGSLSGFRPLKVGHFICPADAKIGRSWSCQVCPADWSPGQLLERVASGAFHALIDTGGWTSGTGT